MKNQDLSIIPKDLISTIAITNIEVGYMEEQKLEVSKKIPYESPRIGQIKSDEIKIIHDKNTYSDDSPSSSFSACGAFDGCG